MFLRGVGTGNGKVGPALKTVQQDDVEAHLHAININTTSNGNHSHTTSFSNDDYDGSSGGRGGDTGLEDDCVNTFNRTLSTSTTGAHIHNVNGNTALNGSETETRPINYGVNYIIKI